MEQELGKGSLEAVGGVGFGVPSRFVGLSGGPGGHVQWCPLMSSLSSGTGPLQLLLCRVPLPASGPVHELPHRPGHVCLL